MRTIRAMIFFANDEFVSYDLCIFSSFCYLLVHLSPFFLHMDSPLYHYLILKERLFLFIVFGFHTRFTVWIPRSLFFPSTFIHPPFFFFFLLFFCTLPILFRESYSRLYFTFAVIIFHASRIPSYRYVTP
ncbi:hypothetical protein DFP73DRAFT_68646 [Morchella snyderi]|nr:hypothetical protein DFP73DRAFT_68646 [Morchella snyderi]